MLPGRQYICIYRWTCMYTCSLVYIGSLTGIGQLCSNMASLALFGIWQSMARCGPRRGRILDLVSTQGEPSPLHRVSNIGAEYCHRRRDNGGLDYYILLSSLPLRLRSFIKACTSVSDKVIFQKKKKEQDNSHRLKMPFFLFFVLFF